MRINLYSLILVSFCALLSASCSENRKDIVQTEIVAPAANYTLAATETMDELPPINSYGSKQVTQTLKSRLEKFAPKKEDFIIKHTDISTLTCENGTVVKFDPDIFVYADSKLPVNEDILISVTEYLSTSDILFKGLTTTCNNRLIETAGMIYIEASADGRVCEIKEGEFYNIEIPSDSEKKNMELFYGEENENGINWVSANRGNFIGYDNRSYFSCMMGIRKKPAFPGGIKSMYEYLHDQYIFPEGFEEVRSAGGINLKATSYVNFLLNYEGQPKKVYTSEYLRTYADSQLVTAFINSPCWDVNISRGDYKPMLIAVKMDWVRDPKNIPAKLIAADKPADKKFSASYEADRYLLVSAQLGWINCDRFTDPQTPKTNLFVALDSTFDATVRIVFNDISAVMGGIRFSGGFEFQNIPAGEKATVVALRNNNGNMELSVQEVVLDGSPIKELTFKPVNKEQLITHFEQIGKDAELASLNPK